MCYWPLRAHTSLQSILGPILLQTPSQSLLGKYVIFVIPCNSVTFYFYELTHGDYFTFHFHLQYKHTGMFALFSESVRPHSSYSFENVTSGTSPLASYKAVTPPPAPTHPGLILYNQHMFHIQEHNLQNIFSPFAGCQYFIQNIKKQHIHYWTGSRIQHYGR